MLNNIKFSLFYLSILSLIAIFVLYAIGKIEIIKAFNYGSISYGFCCFFLTVVLIRKQLKILQILSFAFALCGFLLWNLSLLKWIDFYQFGGISFLFLMISVMMALYGKVILRSSKTSKIVLSVSFLYLVIATYLTNISYFDNSFVLMSALMLFTMIGIFVYIIPKNKI